MLTIRLQRTGTKNKPAFRLVLAEKERSASKKFHEVLGSYNPRSKDFAVKDDVRLKYWLAQNVELSPTVHNLLVEKKLVEAKKVKAWAPKKSGEAGKEAAAAPATAASVESVPSAQASADAPSSEPTPEPAA